MVGGLVAMPLVGIVPGLAIIAAGAALAELASCAAGQAERRRQAPAAYPSYKY
jgi:hypothetical protein